MTALTEAAMAGATPFRESFMHRTELLRGLSRGGRFTRSSAASPSPLTPRFSSASSPSPTAIVTGAYQPFVEDICERVGLSAFVGSTVRYTADGDFDGLDPEGIIDAEGKRAFLEEWTAGALASTLYTGDGANDLDALARRRACLFYTAQHGDLRGLIHQILSADLPPLFPTTR